MNPVDNIIISRITNQTESKRIKMVRFVCSTCKMINYLDPMAKPFETESLTEAMDHVTNQEEENHNVFIEYVEHD